MDYKSGMGATIVDQLSRLGSDLTKPHDFEFYFYFNNQQIASQVAAIMEAKGYKTSVEASANGGGTWLCLASKKMFVEESVLDNLGSEFEDLAQNYDGEFDGWESQVIKS